MGWRQGDKGYTNNWSFIYIQPFLHRHRQALNRYMNGTATLCDWTNEQVVVGSTSDSAVVLSVVLCSSAARAGQLKTTPCLNCHLVVV